MTHNTPGRPTAPVRVRGLLRVHPRGFGFVEHDGESVFVPGSRLGGFLDGDTVTVRTRRGKRDGERIVIGLDLNTRHRMSVLGEVTAPGTVRIDPGVSVDSVAISDTTVPVGELVRLTDTDGWQISHRYGPARCDSGFALRFFERYELPIGYDAPVLDDVAVVLDHINSTRNARGAGRQQRRIEHADTCVVTIDEDHSADLDDALDATIDDAGTIRVRAHIADVTEYITPGSRIDVAAAHTPTSVYLPQHVRHMLPPALGADALSLVPGVHRDVVTVELSIDQAGAVSSVDIYESTIVSTCRLNYAMVEQCIEGDRTALEQRAGDSSQAVANTVSLLWAAACRLGHARQARGGVRMVRESDSAAHVRAHELVERLMVATNEAVAVWLTERGMPALFRNHLGIDDAAMESFRETLRAIGVVDIMPTPLTPAGLAAIAAQVPARSYNQFTDAVLAALGRARYDMVNSGHFGLGSAGYVHFTSPLRRYADMCVHRIVKQYLSGIRNISAEPISGQIARINDVSKRAAWAERDAEKAQTINSLSVGDSVTGRIVHVAGDQLKLDVLGVLCNARRNDIATDNTVIEYGTIVPCVVREACPVSGTIRVSHPRARTRRRAQRQAIPAAAGIVDSGTRSTPRPGGTPRRRRGSRGRGTSTAAAT